FRSSTMLCSFSPLFLSPYVTHRDLHSFPTRRSSDLSASRRDSIRASPLPATLISAISRSTEGPSSVKSCTLCTGTRRDNCADQGDRKSTRLNSSHLGISYAVFCLKKKKK